MYVCRRFCTRFTHVDEARWCHMQTHVSATDCACAENLFFLRTDLFKPSGYYHTLGRGVTLCSIQPPFVPPLDGFLYHVSNEQVDANTVGKLLPLPTVHDCVCRTCVLLLKSSCTCASKGAFTQRVSSSDLYLSKRVLMFDFMLCTSNLIAYELSYFNFSGNETHHTLRGVVRRKVQWRRRSDISVGMFFLLQSSLR